MAIAWPELDTYINAIRPRPVIASHATLLVDVRFYDI
jgi:hypothetical protein